MHSVTLYVALFFILIIAVGITHLVNRKRAISKKIMFITTFRNEFIDLANSYMNSYNRFERSGQLDNEKYIWLTMNCNEAQKIVGITGIINYVARFQMYNVPYYQVILNTLPKFRSGMIEDFDIHSTDDCLLRYLGIADEQLKHVKRKLKNPVIWFKEGFHQIVSIPVYVVNIFGLINNSTSDKITNSSFYKLTTGFVGLIAFFSSVVTIIAGKEQTLKFLKKIVEHF